MTLHAPRMPLLLDPLIAEAKRRGRQRRFLAALYALFLVALAAGLTFGLRSSGGGPSGGGFATTGVSARAGALVVPIQRGFHRYDIRGGIFRTGTRPPVLGVTLTNYRVKADASLRTHGVLPLHTRTNGVVLQVALWFRIGAVADPTGLDLPLRLDQRWLQLDVATGTLRYGGFQFQGQTYEARIWIGRKAPPRDRAAVLQALASVHPAQ
jgi:hypothetical protein